MALAQDLFDVFVTLDRNLEHQQNLSLLKFGIIIVRVADNDIASYRPLFAQLLTAAEEIRAGDLVHVGTKE